MTGNLHSASFSLRYHPRGEIVCAYAVDCMHPRGQIHPFENKDKITPPSIIIFQIFTITKDWDSGINLYSVSGAQLDPKKDTIKNHWDISVSKGQKGMITNIIKCLIYGNEMNGQTKVPILISLFYGRMFSYK